MSGAVSAPCVLAARGLKPGLVVIVEPGDERTVHDARPTPAGSVHIDYTDGSIGVYDPIFPLDVRMPLLAGGEQS